jgi:uncharacterized protein
MKGLGLRFKVEVLTAKRRAFEGQLNEELLASCLPGLVGDLGYRVESPATVTGTVYQSPGSEVAVDGQIEISVGFDCTRCMSARSVRISIKQSHALVARSAESEGDQEIVVSDEESAGLVETYEGDEVNLTEVFRQDLVLALPMNPSCETAGVTDCAYKENVQEAESDQIDPRWAPLLELKKKLN